LKYRSLAWGAAKSVRYKNKKVSMLKLKIVLKSVKKNSRSTVLERDKRKERRQAPGQRTLGPEDDDDGTREEGRDDQEAAEEEGRAGYRQGQEANMEPLLHRTGHRKLQEKAYEPTDQNNLASSPDRLIVTMFLSA
jgi:hypothetical protein